MNTQKWFSKAPLILFALYILMTLSACGGGGGGDEGPTIPVTTYDYEVTFSPNQVINTPVAPASITATANFSVARGDETFASGSVTINGAVATAVTINIGYPGEAGPVAVALNNGGGGTWTIPADTLLDDSEFFRLQQAGFYVLIETAQGVLRGQIHDAGWAAVILDLDASTVVPAASSSGKAKAGLVFNPATGIYQVRITMSGISDVISAGFRNAIRGARGEVMMPFEQSLTDPNVWGSRDINNPDASDRFPPAIYRLLLNGSLYFSIETATNPLGELRGQILHDGINVFSVALSDFNVVSIGPPVVSTATGNATVTWDSLTYSLGVAVSTDITDAISVSIHQGVTGENGPLVLSLLPDVTLPGNWSMPMTQLTGEQASAYLNGELYVDVVTAAFVEGELRGQLSEPAPATLLSINATTDPSTLQQVPLDAIGGVLSTTTSGGALVTAEVRPLTVAGMTDFSMTEVESINGFPANVNLLAAVQMEPAGVQFEQPVTISFDVTGMRSPNTILIAFRSDTNGERLELLPLRDSLGMLGYYSTALDGTQVSVDVNGFSNIGIVEALVEEVPGLLSQFLRQGKDFEIQEKFVIRILNLALDTTYTKQELDDLAQNMLADMIRHRRQELSAMMVDFMSRSTLTPENNTEYIDLQLATLITNSFDMAHDQPVTSNAELKDSLGMLVNLASVYGAGLHLQCFVNPVGVEDALSDVAVGLLLRMAEDLLAENPGLTFEELSAQIQELSVCFNQTILNAYFESYDVPSDVITGVTINIVSTTIDNIAGTESSANLSNVASEIAFVEPRLVSIDPVTIEFREISDTLTGIYTNTVRLVLDVPGNGDRTGRIELADEETQSVATSPTEQANGERPVITYSFSDVASGPILITPNSIDITYTFDSLQTSDGLLVNLTRRLTGDVRVGKSFTPLSFADEINLFY